MPKRKVVTTNTTKAKKIAKVTNRKEEENVSQDESIIAGIVNSGIKKPIKEEGETKSVEKPFLESSSDKNNSCMNEKKFFEYDDNDSILEVSDIRENTRIEPKSDLNENKDDCIFETLVDTIGDPAVVVNQTTDGVQSSLKSREESTSSAKKEPQSPLSRNQDTKIMYDAAFITDKRYRVTGESEKKGGAAYTSGRPSGYQRDREFQERRHVLPPPRGNFQPNFRSHQQNRGSNAPNRGGIHHRSIYNQPIYPPGMMEFHPPYFPLHPQMPNPNFGGEYYPFPQPMYPYPEASFPHQPQFTYPGDGFVDPAWYFPQPNFPLHGGGRGQPNFPRGGSGRGRSERYGERGGYFNSRRGGY